MSTYKPGAVAMVRDMSTDDGSEWRAVKDTKGWFGTDPHMGWVSDADVTYVRPLVVLDLAPMYDGIDMGGWDYVVRALRDRSSKAVITRDDIADQIEAQTKPPRIPEPGLYGVVSTEDESGLTIYHWRSHDCWHAEDGHVRQWDDLIDPTLVREGVES